jgi:hypothetical protein
MDGSLSAACRSHAVDRPASRARFRVYTQTHPERGEVERFISNGFFESHSARIQSYLPVLLGLVDASGDIIGALGYRPGAEEPLFLERYLDAPVQQVIAERSGQPVDRQTIVEIGNLACRSADTARDLMWRVARHLLRERFLWVTFTGTRAVRQILRAFPAPVLELARATQQRAGATNDEWGRYYEADPRVVAGFLPAAFGGATTRED